MAKKLQNTLVGVIVVLVLLMFLKNNCFLLNQSMSLTEELSEEESEEESYSSIPGIIDWWWNIEDNRCVAHTDNPALVGYIREDERGEWFEDWFISESTCNNYIAQQKNGLIPAQALFIVGFLVVMILLIMYPSKNQKRNI